MVCCSLAPKSVPALLPHIYGLTLLPESTETPQSASHSAMKASPRPEAHKQDKRMPHMPLAAAVLDTAKPATSPIFHQASDTGWLSQQDQKQPSNQHVHGHRPQQQTQDEIQEMKRWRSSSLESIVLCDSGIPDLCGDHSMLAA
jgi:hypothetical protein